MDNVILKIETLDDTLKIFDWDNALDFYAYDEDGEIELCYDVEEVRLIADTLNKWLEGKGL